MERPFANIDDSLWTNRWPGEETDVVGMNMGQPGETRTNYRLDGEPRAVYWWPYREVLRKLEGTLIPGQVLTQQNNVAIGLIGNSTLLQQHFDLRNPDRTPIEGIDPKTGKPWSVKYAGKSGFIDFIHALDPNTGEILKLPKDVDMQMLCDTNFGRDCRPTDHFYATTVGELNSAGYTVFWAPQRNHPLHVRFVHSSQMTENSPRDLRIRDKERIIPVWKKVA